MKVTLIGAGSAVFAAELIKDILRISEVDGGTFALVDIDATRLELTRKLAGLLIEQTGKNWKVTTSLNRRELLPGSDYVINSIEVGGPQNIQREYEIPLKYRIDQCIGDTIGPGGLFKALRTLPTWLEILKDIEQLCPNALVMNYTNPMSLTVLAALRTTSLKMVGLCHSIQNTSHQIAHYLDLPYDAVKWRAAGINHLAWFVLLADQQGRDLYPLLRERAKLTTVRDQDPVRFELMEHLGVFMTESSGHVSEYLPYIRKRKDIIRDVCGPDEHGGSGFYARTWPEERKLGEVMLAQLEQGTADLERGMEFASYIIEAEVKNKPTVIYGNVSNQGGLISNLPRDGVVEVACLVDAKGIQPTYFGEIPSHLATFNYQHMAFHDLVCRAVIEEDRDAAEHALMVDPLTSAVCSLREIRSLFSEMVEAERDFLPSFLVRTGKGAGK
ncbi:MAG TPA: alpha-glucosidase/alpha-galactosidase [Spirochaetia bacterium]|nr:alpha-glucosidase/alpha-galactosidase [Spirochaetia bacterium]